MAKTANYNRDTILADLRDNVIEVVFDKVNNQPRIMRCTLQREFLPESYKEKADTDYHTANPDVLAVWDLDNKGWRAFRIDSVRMIQALDSSLFR